MSPPEADEIRSGFESNPAEIDQVKLLSPELPDKRTMDEEMVIGFRIGMAHGTNSRRKRELRISGIGSLPSHLPKEALNLVGNGGIQIHSIGKRHRVGGVERVK